MAGLNPVTVLVSASGAPGTAALLKGLRANGERTVRLVGTDMSERSVGRHLCDAFHRVPAGSDPAFADAVLDVVERESVDVVLPQSSFDLEGLAAHRDRFPVPVLVSSPDTIHRSNDKAETYALLDAIGAEWRFDSLIHGDMKWDNVLVFPTPAGLDFRIVDWEMADCGDAGWDVGAVLQSFFSVWIMSMPIGSGLPPEAYIGMASQPLEAMRPVLKAFWQSYASTRGFDAATIAPPSRYPTPGIAAPSDSINPAIRAW